MDPNETCCENRMCFELAHDRVEWENLVILLSNLSVLLPYFVYEVLETVAGTLAEYNVTCAYRRRTYRWGKCF